jgi:protein JSN1
MDNNQSSTRSLWLGNLDSSVTAPDLIAIFSKYGTIESIRILPDRECAFVNFLTKEEALRAKDAFKTQMGSRLGNATVKVGFGKPDAVPQQPACGDTVQGPTRALCKFFYPSLFFY